MTTIDTPTPEVEETTDPMAEKVAGLRALADFLEQHPDLPVPYISAVVSYYGTNGTGLLSRLVAAIAPCTHGDSQYSKDRYEFARGFGGEVALIVECSKPGVFAETVRETTVFELPESLAALAEGRS